LLTRKAPIVDDKPFTVRIVARGYEVDSNGHVAGTVLLQYGQHARWECMRAAGVDHAGLAAREIGPVSLEERIRFHHEIRAGQQPPQDIPAHKQATVFPAPLHLCELADEYL
jgi:hypothetical protein